MVKLAVTEAPACMVCDSSPPSDQVANWSCDPETSACGEVVATVWLVHASSLNLVFETAMRGYREEGGPQQTSMAVMRRKTRMVIRARVIGTVLGIDIRLIVCQNDTRTHSNNFYRAD
jgi:hypothetical protein